MKPVSPPEWHGKWLIDLEFSPWSPKLMVYRIDGKAVSFDTEQEAWEVIKELEAKGEQGRILKHTEPVDVDKAIRRARKAKSGDQPND